MFSSLFAIHLRRLRRFPFSWWFAVLGFALVAGFVVTTSVSKATAAAAKYDRVETVYVARHALVPGTPLSPSDVVEQSRPRSFAPQSARLSDPSGQVADVAIASGDVITTQNTGASGLSVTAALLHPGEVGIATAIGDGSPTFTIGDNVSVIATPQSQDPTSVAGAFIVTSQARVINVTDKAVTIAVSADDAPKVAFAEAKSAITLAITTP